MEFKELVEKLVQLGFSSYEARAYISLLKHHPVTGYELAKSSGIPPSKIYEVIAKLLSRSIISPLSGKPTKYLPQDNRIFLKSLRANFHDTIDYLEKHLPTLGDIDIDYVWNVNDMNNFMTMVKDIIRGAKNNIIVLGWDSELREIMGDLKKCKVKSKLAIIQFGSMNVDIGVVYNHGIEKVLESEKGGRMFSLVADGSNLLQGIFSESKTVRGIYTSHPSLVEMAIDHMVHEIYTTKMYDKFAKEMDRKFGGKHLKKLRNIWKK
jgi:sugar-specific transcriptional regulator TrmB